MKLTVPNTTAFFDRFVRASKHPKNFAHFSHSSSSLFPKQCSFDGYAPDILQIFRLFEKGIWLDVPSPS